MKGVSISVLLVLATVHLMVNQGKAITCLQVKQKFAPCIPYLTREATQPTAECCRGVSDINTMTPTTEEKQEACECVKAAAGHIPNVDEKAAAALPTDCKVDTGIPISKNTNCQDIK